MAAHPRGLFHRDCSSGRLGAIGPETNGCLLIDQSSWLLHARSFCRHRYGGTTPGRNAGGLSGVFMQIFNHGITAAALFYFVGLLEQRRGLRGIGDFGGLMQRTPLLCGWMSVAMFSSLGLPGLNGFIGEFLIFKGSFALAASFTAVAVLGLLFTAVVFM